MSFSRIIAITAALAVLPAETVVAPRPATAVTPLDGVWNYVPPRQGQSLFHGHSYVMFNTRPDSAATSSPPSESDQARLYRSLSLQSGTFTISDTIVTMIPVNGKNPRQTPASWRWSYSLKGDTLTWHVLNAQGQATSSGVSVRAAAR